MRGRATTGAVSLLTWKLRISVLWVALAICQSAGMAMALFEPGVGRDLLAGHMYGEDVRSAQVQISTALNWLVPMAMAYLTLVLKDGTNRSTNALLGAGSALYGLSVVFSRQGGTSAGFYFVDAVAILVAVLIAWHAWKWPRPSEVFPPDQKRETKLR